MKFIDHRHPPQKVIAKHIHRKLIGRKKCGRKRCHRKRRPSSKEWTRAGISASRATTHSLQEMSYNIHIHSATPPLNQRQRQKRLTWTVAQWSKILFSDKSRFCISLGNQGPRVWRKSGDAQNVALSFVNYCIN